MLAQRGERILLPDPGYPDYNSAVALAGAERVALPLDGDGRPDWAGAPRERVAAVYLNYPANPAAVAAPPGVFAEAIEFAHETGAAIVHDFAYADLVFDGRRPESFLAEDGAREVGVEMFSLSKSYGMAGWRLGFVVGNAEIVARLNLVQEHARSGIFVAAPARRDRSADRAAGHGRGAARPLRAPARPRARCNPGRPLRGDVLRLVPAP